MAVKPVKVLTDLLTKKQILKQDLEGNTLFKISGTLGDGTVSSSFPITASYFVGDGRYLTNIYGEVYTSGSITGSGLFSNPVYLKDPLVIGGITASYIYAPEITGSLFGTASFATTAAFAENAINSVYTTGSVTGSGLIANPITLTDPLIINTLTASTGISGDLFGTASFATNALTAAFASNAANSDPFPYTGSAIITGSLTVTGSTSLTNEINSTVLYANANTIVFTGSTSLTNDVGNIVLFANADTIDFTGSINNSGTVTVSDGIYGRLYGTASYALNAETASYILNSVTASYAVNALSSSFATTASFANNATTASYSLNSDKLDNIDSTGFAILTASNTFTNTQTISGNLNVVGTVTAQQLSINYVTSSVLFTSGSTKFGDTVDDTHQFTGSLFVSNNVTAPNFIGTASYATNAGTASYVTASSIANFTSDVRRQLSGSQYITYNTSSGVILLPLTGSTVGTTAVVLGTTVTSLSGLTSVSSSAFTGSGLNVTNITASNITNFTNDVRAQHAAGANLTYTTGAFALNTNINLTSVTASFSGNGAGITGVVSSSFATTASFANSATSASFATNATSASFATNAATASYITASNIVNFTSDVRRQLSGSQYVTYNTSSGVISLPSTGSTIGSTAVVLGTTITSLAGLTSVSSSAFTGSGLNITNITASNISNFTTDVRAQHAAGANLTYTTGAYALNANISLTSVTASFSGNGAGITGVVSSSFATNATSASFATNAATASYVTASSIVNFTSDVRKQLSGSQYVTYNTSSGVISLPFTGSVIGSTAVLLGATVTSLSGLTSVSSSAFTGSGANIINITASNINNFTSDVRAQHAAGVNLTYTTGAFALNNNINLTSVTASFSGNGAGITGVISSSFATTSSYAANADKLDNIDSTGFAILTASNVFTNNQIISGNLDVSGIVTANELHITYTTSSVVFTSGSTKFGNTNDDTHQFTGSLFVTGNVTANNFIGTASYATNALSSSYAATASYAVNAANIFPYTGSAIITGSLTVTGSTNLTNNAGSTVLYANADTIVFTGSLFTSGSTQITGTLSVSDGIYGRLYGTASYAINAATASFIDGGFY